MAHRVHPEGFRINSLEDWRSRGFYGKRPAKMLEEDFKIRRYLKKELENCDVEKIEIERFPSTTNVIINSARPGMIIGRRGERVAILKTKLEKLINSEKGIRVEIRPIKNPWLSASLSAQWIARRLEKRMPYRRVIKQALSKIVVNKGVEGARVQVSGRLNGTLMARTEWQKEGKLKRQTLRGEMDYAHEEAKCSYGVIGVKVWIYKGEKIE